MTTQAHTPSFFAVTPDDLKRLSPSEAVDVVRSLLWAEGYRLQIPYQDISVPSAVMVSDGGIDAEVRNFTGKTGALGIIRPGVTRFQVKTGSFSLGSDADIKSILLKPKARRPRKGTFTPDDLQPRVRSSLDSGGTLVVVLFGSDNPDATDDQTKAMFLELLTEIDATYAGASIEIWRPNHLMAFVEHFPAIALTIKGVVPDTFAVPHSRWFAEGAFDGETFVHNDETKKAVAAIRDLLKRPSSHSTHIRFVGEAGIGKSRLIYEATDDPSLRSLVIYASDTDDFLNSALFQRLVADASRLNLILVADECPPVARGDLRVRLRKLGGTVRVVSIYNEEDEGDTGGELQYFDAPRLGDDQIHAIIRGYGVPDDDARFWASQCDGSPRTAHVVAQNLMEHKDVLRGDDLVRIWDRYVAGKEDPRSPEASRRRLILRCLALFKRVGWDTDHHEESMEVYNKVVRPLEPLSPHEYIEIIERLRKRRILQGVHTLYITPKLLHIRLWREWWENYRRALPIEPLLQTLSEQLADWFIDMLVYAKSSPATQELALELLGPKGPFYKSAFLNTKRGSDLFFNLAQVEPRVALHCLADTLGKQDVAGLRTFKEGRFQIVRALEYLAIHADLFVDAAKLLLSLAEAETESYSNNASGIFADLFTLGWGKMATSQLPPGERLTVLLEAIRSGSVDRRKLALEAFDRALQTRFSRMALDEFHGLTRIPERWSPKTYGEIQAEYKRYWTTLRDLLPELQPTEATKAAHSLVHHARELFAIDSLRGVIVETLRDIEGQRLLPPGRVLEAVVQIQHYDGKTYPAEVRAVIDNLCLELQGSGFASMLRRYVGLGLLEDQFDEEGNQTTQLEEHVARLANDTIANPSLLTPELRWLVTDEAKNGYTFGSFLAERDKDLVFWDPIRQAWLGAADKAHDFFIGGYLNGLFRRDSARWQTLVFEMAGDGRFLALLPTLVWRSGITDSIAHLLTELATARKISPLQLRVFSYGGVAKRIQVSEIEQWLRLLLKESNWQAAAAAIELFDYRFRPSEKDEEPFPSALAYAVLTHPSFVSSSEERHRRDTMTEYHWSKVALKLARADSELALELFDRVLLATGEKGTFLGRYGSEANKFLDEVARLNPDRAWKIASKYIEPPINTRGYMILQWLRGLDDFRSGDNKGAFQLFPRKLLWEWVDRFPEKHAYLLAHYCPRQVQRIKGQPSLALQILERYGHREDVRSALTANYHTEGWSGPASAHLRAKLVHLEGLLASERNPNVVRWIREEIDSLQKWIKKEEITEERRGF